MRSRLFWITTSGLLGLALAAPASRGADNASARPKVDGKKKAKLSASEARAVVRDLQELAEAVRKDSKAGSESDALESVNRPERTVTAPNLKPADLDRMLAKVVAAEGVKPAGLADDEEFARRLWLDLTGTPPSPEEVRAFVEDTDPEKRSKLIDQLLGTEDFGRNWARYWRDAIRYRATVSNPRQADYPSLEEWLTTQFNENRPWDEIAREMIAATGDSTENGAVGFTASHMARPAEVAGEVSRLFMGVQIQCAECHDHPTDPWKREQFHEFAAFFAGTNSRRNKKTAKLADGVLVTTRPNRVRYAMPDLKDPKHSIPIEPRFFFATEDEIPEDLTAQQRRVVAASYVTGQDNPYFAKAFVNRIWTALVGTAFYLPVDDMGPAREGQATEVLDRLASEWASGGYDIKWLFRTVLSTKAYARQSRAVSSEAGSTPFAAACPTQLRADQILDSLAQALELPLDDEDGKKTSRKRGRFNARRIFELVFGVDPSVPADEVMGTIPQALFLMNSPQINRALKATPDSVLGEVLAENPDDKDAVQALYLRVLAREPSAAERETCSDYIAKVGDRQEAFEDLFWALINSAEFISRR